MEWAGRAEARAPGWRWKSGAARRGGGGAGAGGVGDARLAMDLAAELSELGAWSGRWRAGPSRAESLARMAADLLGHPAREPGGPGPRGRAAEVSGLEAWRVGFKGG